DGLCLGGVDAGGGGEPAGGGVLGLGAPGVLVGEVGVDRVDRAAAVGARGQQHAGTGVADHVAVAAVGAAGGGTAEGGDEVLTAPHQRGHVGVGGERRRGEDAAGRLAQPDHLHAGQSADDPVHGGRSAHLGQHHPAGTVRAERQEVRLEVR